MAKTTNIIEHHDILGRPLAAGDVVVFSSSNSMYVGSVIKLNPKMIKIKRLGGNYKWEQNKYPNDVARVDGPEVTMYLLKHSG